MWKSLWGSPWKYVWLSHTFKPTHQLLCLKCIREKSVFIILICGRCFAKCSWYSLKEGNMDDKMSFIWPQEQFSLLVQEYFVSRIPATSPDISGSWNILCCQMHACIRRMVAVYARTKIQISKQSSITRIHDDARGTLWLGPQFPKQWTILYTTIIAHFRNSTI